MFNGLLKVTMSGHKSINRNPYSILSCQMIWINVMSYLQNNEVLLTDGNAKFDNTEVEITVETSNKRQ